MCVEEWAHRALGLGVERRVATESGGVVTGWQGVEVPAEQPGRALGVQRAHVGRDLAELLAERPIPP